MNNFVGSALALVALQSAFAPGAIVAAPVATEASRSASSIDDLAWLAGHWTGAGIAGGQAVEVYSAPAGGQMVGHFRQLKPDGTILFYELITIAEAGSALEYRVKHFHPDMTAWEEKAEVTAFPLRRINKNLWQSNGFAIRRIGPDLMTMLVRVKDRTGAVQDLRFDYRRSPACPNRVECRP